LWGKEYRERRSAGGNRSYGSVSQRKHHKERTGNCQTGLVTGPNKRGRENSEQKKSRVEQKHFFGDADHRGKVNTQGDGNLSRERQDGVHR